MVQGRFLVAKALLTAFIVTVVGRVTNQTTVVIPVVGVVFNAFIRRVTIIVTVARSFGFGFRHRNPRHHGVRDGLMV